MGNINIKVKHEKDGAETCPVMVFLLVEAVVLQSVQLTYLVYICHFRLVCDSNEDVQSAM